MSKNVDKQRWARLRFAIVGPLLASPPAPGELQQALRALSQRHWTHPNTGLPVSFGVSTIENWYYTIKNHQDPVAALSRQRRSDAGSSRVFTAPVVAQVHALYKQHPGWSVQLHHDNLCAAASLFPELGTVPSYSSLKRYFRNQGLIKRRKPKTNSSGAHRAVERMEAKEIRSYETEHVGALYHLDFHHCSRRVLEPDGSWIKPLLLGVIDDHSRLGCHFQWYRAEDTQALVHGFCQALAKRGLPRSCMSDNGSAMISEEFVSGLHNLGIVHERTLAFSAYQNGKQETLWATLEARLMAMIDSEKQLTLDQLNRLTQIWLEHDYHRNLHSEIGTTPLRRFVEGESVLRDAPDGQTLRYAFMKRATRRQRRSDGTCTLEGRRFEIPSRFGHLETVTLRYARWDLSDVQMIDPDTGVSITRVYPLDKAANANAVRRAREPRDVNATQAMNDNLTPAPVDVVDEQGLSPLMRKLVREFAATGLPPGFISSPDKSRDAITQSETNNPHDQTQGKAQ